MNSLIRAALKGLVVLLTATIFSCGGSPESNIPPPTTVRTDLLFGYIGSSNTQLAETSDHVNIFFAGTWDGQEAQLSQAMFASSLGLPIMLDVADQVGLPFDAASAEVRTRTRLQQLQLANVLGSVKAFYFDEPDLNNRMSSADVVAMNSMLRRVAGEFGATPALATIYTAGFTWPGVSSFDWVGFDNYGAGSSIFVNGDYGKLKAALFPTQRIILVPGGADPWRTDPTQFFNMAQQDLQVIAVMPFAWPDGTTKDWGAGIRSNGMAPAYKAVGLRIKNGK